MNWKKRGTREESKENEEGKWIIVVHRPLLFSSSFYSFSLAQHTPPLSPCLSLVFHVFTAKTSDLCDWNSGKL